MNAIKPNEPTSKWKIALAILCVLIIWFNLTGKASFEVWLALLGGHYVSAASYLAISSLVLPFLVWLVFFFTSTRKRGWKVSLLAFVCLYASGLIGSSIEAGWDMATFKRQLKEADEAEHETQVLLSFVDSSFALIQKPGQIYRAELMEMGWLDTLKPAHFAADPKLEQSQNTCKLAERLVNQYRQEALEALETMMKNIDALPVSESKRQSLRDSLNDGIRKSAPRVQRFWKVEQDGIMTVKASIEMLASNTDKWSIENGKMVFTDLNLMHSFDDHLAKLQEIGQEQIEINNTLIERYKQIEANLQPFRRTQKRP